MSDLSEHDALLLVGHGSSRHPEAADALLGLAERLRRPGLVGQVEVGLLNGEPSVATALARIEAPAVRVVPFFMEDGHFTRVAVPRALLGPHGDASRSASGDAADGSCGGPSGGRRVLICPPVGVHDGMAGLIERQALAACDALGIHARTGAVLIVGHGSSSAPGRTLALHVHAARVAATALFARVETACLEEPPFVPEVLLGLRAHPVVVIGFFAGQGAHVLDDLPALLEAERAARAAGGEPGRSLRFHGCVTDDPAMLPIVLDQARVGVLSGSTEG
ncbi:MAG TPA: CbiX/SirB N-terminal domain-containing protein [Rhodopila sp.]